MRPGLPPGRHSTAPATRILPAWLRRDPPATGSSRVRQVMLVSSRRQAARAPDRPWRGAACKQQPGALVGADPQLRHFLQRRDTGEGGGWPRSPAVMCSTLKSFRFSRLNGRASAWKVAFSKSCQGYQQIGSEPSSIHEAAPLCIRRHLLKNVQYSIKQPTLGLAMSRAVPNSSVQNPRSDRIPCESAKLAC